MKIRIKELARYSPQVYEQNRADELLVDTNAAPTVLEQVYNPVVVRTDEGVEFGICARDEGIEVVRVTDKPTGVLVCSIKQSLRAEGEELYPEIDIVESYCYRTRAVVVSESFFEQLCSEANVEVVAKDGPMDWTLRSDFDAPFRKQLEGLLNRCSKENGSDTPDSILARYLADCLRAFDHAVCRREEWYGRGPEECGEPLVGDGEDVEITIGDHKISGFGEDDGIEFIPDIEGETCFQCGEAPTRRWSPRSSTRPEPHCRVCLRKVWSHMGLREPLLSRRLDGYFDEGTYEPHVELDAAARDRRYIRLPGETDDEFRRRISEETGDS